MVPFEFIHLKFPMQNTRLELSPLYDRNRSQQHSLFLPHSYRVTHIYTHNKEIAGFWPWIVFGSNLPNISQPTRETIGIEQFQRPGYLTTVDFT